MEADFPTTTRLHPFSLMATPFRIKGVALPKGCFTLNISFKKIFIQNKSSSFLYYLYPQN